MLDWLTHADHAAFFFINGLAGGELIQDLAEGLSDLGRYPVLLLALIGLALEGPSRFRRHVLALLLIMPLAYGANFGLKEAYERSRPMGFYDDEVRAGQVHINGQWMTRKSFPSGHTTFAFFAMGYLALARRRLAGPALTLAFLIAWSRVARGVHFPFDCLAGAGLGMFWAFLAWRIHGYWEQRAWKENTEPIPASGPRSGSF
jgi:undecaprenyl-diphosphatase